MGHILIPIDFSIDSVNALEHAIILANTMHYDIRLIHVKRKNADYNTSFNLVDFNEVLISGIENNFEKLLQQYQRELKGEMDYRIRDGRVYNEICNQAKYGDSELIVMGTHGVSGFEEHWIGSNAFRVVQNAMCPVLTIRYNAPKRPIGKILIPIDISKETRIKVPFIANLAIIFKAEVHIVDVRENNKAATIKTLKEYVNQVILYLERRNVTCIRDSLKGNNLSKAIIEYALFNDIDLIAIMKEGGNNSVGFIETPYAQQMVNHSPIPIITFPING